MQRALLFALALAFAAPAEGRDLRALRASCRRYGETTNRVWWSNDLTQWWTLRGTAGATKDGTLCPDGVTLASKVTGLRTVAVGDIYQSVGGFSGSEALATSLWIKRVSASGTLTIGSPQGSQFGAYSVNLATLGAEWVRIVGNAQTGVTGTAFTANGGNAGVHFSSAAADDLSFYVCHVQQESGSVSPPIVTGSGAVTRAPGCYR